MSEWKLKDPFLPTADSKLLILVNFDDVARYDSKAGAVFFYGHCDDGTILFACTCEALIGAERLMAPTEAELMQVFHKHRTRIRAIARAKYIAGAVEKKGICIVKAVDLNR